MNTSDMSLRMFLDQYNIGTGQEVPSSVLQEFGHTEHSASEIEILTYELAKKSETGELPWLAAGYCLKCGYRRITVSCQMISPEKDGDVATCAGFKHTCIVSAEDDELPRLVIIVSYGDKLASFTKHGASKN